MFRKLVVALSLATVVTSSVFAQNREYALVIHGGAGAMGSLEDDPEKSVIYYAALDSALMIGNDMLAPGLAGAQVVMA